MRSNNRGGWEVIIDYLLCQCTDVKYVKIVFQMHFTITETVKIKFITEICQFIALTFNKMINFDVALQN